ncbi:unnamed protein product [Trichobilharzia regenti]|nr:unnamed protein product [Trichobilharzia regenti]
MPSVTTTNTVNTSGIRLMRKTSCAAGASSGGGGASAGASANDQSTNSSSHQNSDKKSLRDQPNVGKYKLIRTLGRGNFAKVKLAQHVSTGREVKAQIKDSGCVPLRRPFASVWVSEECTGSYTTYAILCGAHYIPLSYGLRYDFIDKLSRHLCDCCFSSRQSNTINETIDEDSLNGSCVSTSLKSLVNIQ